MEHLQILAFVAAIVVVVGLYVIYEWRLRRDLKRTLKAREPVAASDFGATHYSDDTTALVATFVLGKLEELTGHDLTGALPQDRIVADLHLDEIDSLATVEILNEIEARFGVSISDQEAAATRTLDDVVRVVTAKVQALRVVV